MDLDAWPMLETPLSQLPSARILVVLVMTEEQVKDVSELNAELKRTKITARYQLLSTFFGTFLVSVIGSYLVFVQNVKKDEQAFDTSHRDFVSKFVDIAIDEDIERRQRLARYFASVTLDETQKERWEEYAAYVETLIVSNPAEIAELKEKLPEATETDRAKLEARIRFLEQQLGASGTGANVQTDTSRECIQQNSTFPGRWYCIADNEMKLGVKEIPGSASNPRILEYAQFAIPQANETYSNDDIPWNGLFAAWVISQSGVDREYLPKNPLGSRQWLEFGEPVEKPEPGVLAVFWRGSAGGTAGHVAFYSSEDESSINVIGGNQTNAVTMARLPKNRLLGYRTFSQKVGAEID